MFQRALKLILAQCRWPIGLARESGQLQEDIVANLKVVQHAKCPYECPRITPLAIRFVQGESWTLLYLWLKCKHGWPGGAIEGTALTKLEDALEVHFSAIELESDLAACEGN